MTSQFTFNNLKSYDDFQLTISELTIGHPSVNVISQTVPFMNGNYDFSSLYGGQTYSNREVKMVLFLNDLVDYSRERLNILYDKVINWLFQSEISTLKIDYVEYVFRGRVTAISEKKKFVDTESIEVTFDCYPFRISEYYEGHDIWDIFNFELDYAQQTSFTITNSTDIILYNPSAISITPTVICTSDMTIQMNDTTYKFVAGTTKDYRFKLAKGENHMTITGQGDIEFKFRKEVL